MTRKRSQLRWPGAFWNVADIAYVPTSLLFPEHCPPAGEAASQIGAVEIGERDQPSQIESVAVKRDNVDATFLYLGLCLP